MTGSSEAAVRVDVSPPDETAHRRYMSACAAGGGQPGCW